jgi:hypothetical protein
VIELHRFKTGQSVELVANDLRLKSLGAFTVVRAMPAERGIQHYRVKSVKDGHERVVLESELTQP